ncbi:SRPBCC family protein [Streptomyces sp. RPT161]|uniref:SRPBCC family protein n=1 Tax=Streptomyces sp. RPT161 TaxID=3015993 RepID=UPI0022B8B416|nr:SRPBCC family protein [Streptomyces sp. RPT161]
MVLFQIQRCSALPTGEAWSRLTRWERHGAHVPLTRVVVTTSPPTRVGTRFAARTGVGAIGFDDPMEVVLWDPPAGGTCGLCRLEKRGSVVSGWATIEVRPRGTGCWIQWREDLRVRWLPSVFDRPVRWIANRVFDRVLDALLRE